jgi:tRNA1(Val) A37 N6-methylase TrmN6
MPRRTTFNSIPHGIIRPRRVKGANRNAKEAGHSAHISFEKASATGLSAVFSDGEFDALVTNPPWGVMVGLNADLEPLYRKFLSGAWRVVKPGGRVVVIVLHALLFLDIIRSYGQYAVLDVRVVKTRNNMPTIFVLERLEQDPLYSDLKNQLFAIHKYVNMANSMFKAIHSGKAAFVAASAEAEEVAAEDVAAAEATAEA